MLNYILILFADVFLAVNSLAQKKYQSSCGTALVSSLEFSMVSGAVSAAVFFVLCGFSPRITVYSAVMALCQTICCLSYLCISFVILKKSTLALYSSFLMIGGMLLPYIYGIIFLNEMLTAPRTIGIVLIMLALILFNVQKGKVNRQLIPLLLAVFLLNGCVSIISKEHQINTELAVGTNDFVFLTSFFKVLICIPIYLILKTKKKTSFHIKSRLVFGITVVCGLATAFSYLLQLTGAKGIAASILYPMVTGGSIILTALSGRIILGERLSRMQKTAIGLCTAGTLLFL